MKYAIWFLRLVFAAWFIPAGLNHFIPLFPQPMGNQPLSTELITALIDSHLFDLVKFVELVAGIAVLTGWYMPLMLVVCMPVSFCVWYWDTPLQGWGTVSSIYGWAAFGSNALLCLAYLGSYRKLFEIGATAKAPVPKNVLLAGRLLFGAWLLVSGINYFVGSLYPIPTGTTPLAMQLATALDDSGMMGVVKGIEIVTGALIVTGAFVPLALCVTMPLSACTFVVGALIDHQPIGIVASTLFVGLNGLLMLAYLDSYKSMLVRRALAAGETAVSNFDTLYINPVGGSPLPAIGAALIPLLLAAGLYNFVVSGLTGKFCLIVLIIPTVVLVARAAQGMGKSASPA